MRDELDRYYTPTWATLALLRRVRVSGRVLEPCAGMGSIADALRASWHISRVKTGDIDPGVQVDHYWDFVELPPTHITSKAGDLDWIVTNPPYSLISKRAPFVRAALACCDRVALLMPGNWCQPTDGRVDLLETSTRQIHLPRISFDGKGTPFFHPVWFVWERYGQRLPPLYVPRGEIPKKGRG